MPSVLATESWPVVEIILPSMCSVVLHFQWPAVEWCGVWTFGFLDEVSYGADRLGGLAYPRVENSAMYRGRWRPGHQAVDFFSSGLWSCCGSYANGARGRWTTVHNACLTFTNKDTQKTLVHSCPREKTTNQIGGTQYSRREFLFLTTPRAPTEAAAAPPVAPRANRQ